ncbi:hypothetical protein A2U01_0076226, partial [Trifolium medium]|nr:hypothetical protein [Trifolium medium]
FRDELVDIQSGTYQLLCEDGSVSEAGRGITVDEHVASEGIREGESRVICGVRVLEAGE